MDRLQYNVNHYGQYMTVNISDYANIVQFFVSEFNVIDDERVITEEDINNIIKLSNGKYVPNFIPKQRKNLENNVDFDLNNTIYKYYDEESLSNYLSK